MNCLWQCIGKYVRVLNKISATGRTTVSSIRGSALAFLHTHHSEHDKPYRSKYEHFRTLNGLYTAGNNH